MSKIVICFLIENIYWVCNKMNKKEILPLDIIMKIHTLDEDNQKGSPGWERENQNGIELPNSNNWADILCDVLDHIDNRFIFILRV